MMFLLLFLTAQISFHNCHIPFIGSKKSKESCARGETCRTPPKGEAPFTDEELDYYACLVELDNAVGILLKALKTHGYYDNTMVRYCMYRLSSERHTHTHTHTSAHFLTSLVFLYNTPLLSIFTVASLHNNVRCDIHISCQK